MFDEVISLNNLFKAWEDFRKDKLHNKDVIEFEFSLEDNVFELHEELKNGGYKHGGYSSFYVCDPKRRHIHKPTVRDRLVHHAVVRVLEPIFDKKFIFDSWSSRKGKGTHAALERLQTFGRRLSLNHTKNLWILKLDIKKYFDSVDHRILLGILRRRIFDERLIGLVTTIIDSYYPGLPLGNLTSQLFANVYLDSLDQFVKHELKTVGYLRYADDIVFLHRDKSYLTGILKITEDYLSKHLKLNLNPRKIELKTFSSGIDYLGYVCFPHHRVLRSRTKRRMFTRIDETNYASYGGVLSHCRSRDMRIRLGKYASTNLH